MSPRNCSSTHRGGRRRGGGEDRPRARGYGGRQQSDRKRFHADVQAAEKGREAVVRVLIEAGADVNNDSMDGRSLSIAVENGFDAIVQMLTEAGAVAAEPYSSSDLDRSNSDDGVVDYGSGP